MLITLVLAFQACAAALSSARMNFADPDAGRTDRLNRILWHDARGWDTRYPGAKHAIFFFPLSIDLADDEREKREEQRTPGANPAVKSRKPIAR